MEKFMSLIDDAVGLGEIGDQASITERLQTLDFARIVEMQNELSKALPRTRKRKERYRFIANSETSGLRYPCSSFRCRGRELRKLAYFSAAYADEVAFFDPFPLIRAKPARKSEFCSELAFHISEILVLKPLIDRGIVSFIDFNTHSYCEDCFRKGLAAATGFDEDTDMFFSIARDVIEKTDLVYRISSVKGLHFDVITTSEFYGHERGTYILYGKIKEIKGLRKGEKLTRNQIESLGIASRIASFASNDLFEVNKNSSSFGIRNLIASRPQVSVLREYFGTDRVGKDIDIKYPFIAQGKIDEIMKFRDDEWHHLHDFRNFIDDCITGGVDFSKELENEYSKIEHIVRRNDRKFNKNILTDAGVLATNMVATVATAGVSSLIAGLIGALGGGHFATKMIPDLIGKFSEPEEIRESKIYYAWKVVQRAPH